MFWIFYSFGSGLLEGVLNAFSKKILHSEQSYILSIIFLKFAVAVPLYILMWIGIDGMAMPHSWLDFSAILAVLIAAEIGGQYFFHKALFRCPLTIITPFQALIPVLMIPIAWLLLGEMPSMAGAGGIGLIALSVALLGYEYAQSKKSGLILISKKGILSILLACIFWSLTSVLQKPATELSSPAFLGMMYLGGVALSFACMPGILRKTKLLTEDASVRSSLLPLFFYAPVGYMQYTALTLAHPSYVMSIKSSARLFNMLWDRHLFRERLTGLRIWANILSIIGVIVLLVFR